MLYFVDYSEYTKETMSQCMIGHIQAALTRIDLIFLSDFKENLQQK